MPLPFMSAFGFGAQAPAAQSDDIKNALEFIPHRLYYVTLPSRPRDTADTHYFTVDDVLIYVAFFGDFGPPNLAHLVRFIEILNEKLMNPALTAKRIVLFSGPEADKRANACYLLCAYMLLQFKLTAAQACAPITGITPALMPYRDAGYGSATYFISVQDCVQGLHKALTLGLLDLQNLDQQHYEFYERVEHGDFNWLGQKYLALACPRDDDREGPSVMYASHIYESPSIPRPPCQRQFQNAYKMEDLCDYLQRFDVSTIVRLNNVTYDRQRFLRRQVQHVELYFPDGTTPPENILQAFLQLVETTSGPLAVHCKAGLGRTGSLIACYYMKHYLFTASEIIAYLRICRPGSVVGPQQNWLAAMQPRLHAMKPQTILPQQITGLKPSTFAKTNRWDLPDRAFYGLNGAVPTQVFAQRGQGIPAVDPIVQLYPGQFDPATGATTPAGGAKKPAALKMDVNVMDLPTVALPQLPGSPIREGFEVPIQPRKGEDMADQRALAQQLDRERERMNLPSPTQASQAPHNYQLRSQNKGEAEPAPAPAQQVDGY